MRALKYVFAWCKILTIILLLTLYSHTAKNYINNQQLQIHKTLYLDRQFNEYEINQITIAALEWNSATNGIVNFDIVILPTKENINIKASVLIIKISPDYPEVIIMEKLSNKILLGYYNETIVLPHIALITSRLDDFSFRPTVEHELGHAIGLQHTEGIDGANTLMYPTQDLAADFITKKDLEQLCKIYGYNIDDLTNQ